MRRHLPFAITAAMTVASVSGCTVASTPSTSCDAYDEAVRGSKLADLDVGTPLPPFPKGFDELGAAIVPPRIRLSEVVEGDVKGGDPDRNTVLVVGRMKGSGGEIRDAAEAALEPKGFRRIGGGSGSENGKLTSFNLRYEGHGLTGDISMSHCKGGNRVVVRQVIRLDRVGDCRRPELADRCRKLFDQAVALVERPVGGATAPEGAADFQPLGITMTPAGKLRAALRATSGMRPAVLTSEEVKRAFDTARWRRAGSDCDPRQERCIPDLDHDNGPVTRLEYTTPGYRAVVSITDNDTGDGGVTVEAHMEEA